MADRCLLYYITDRSAFPGDERARRRLLLEKIAEAAAAGVDYIQLREKNLPVRDLESLAGEAMRIIRDSSPLATGDRQPAPALLINSRTDIALATGAAGVHLPAGDISPEDATAAWKRSAGTFGAGPLAREKSLRSPLISVSCHSPEEVIQAAVHQVTLTLFAPVFEKQSTPGLIPQGLDPLRQACKAKIPVLALGGITLENAKSCLDAGAAGIAAIRLFQQDNVAAIVRALRD